MAAKRSRRALRKRNCGCRHANPPSPDHGNDVDGGTNARIDRELADPRVTTTFGGRGGKRRGAQRNPGEGEETTKDWRSSWKRGANLIVLNDGLAGSNYVVVTSIVLRSPGRGTKIDVYTGRSMTPQKRRAVPVEYMVITEHSVHYEQTHLILQNDGLPARRQGISKYDKSKRDIWTYGRKVEAGARRLPDGSLRWYSGSELRDGQHWSLGPEIMLDAYGTRVDELLEIAQRGLPTGAYKVTR